MQPNWNSIRATIARKFPDVACLTTEELALWVDDPQREDPWLFDVRTQAEFEQSHLGKARWATNAKKIQKILSEDIAEMDPGPIVVYCSVGYRSAKVAQALMRKYNIEVFNLDGSIFQWFNEGRSVYRSGDSVDGEIETQEVHPFDSQWGALLDR